MSLELGRARNVRSASDGSFRFDDLATGTYRLGARGSGAAQFDLRPLRVEAGKVLDVGSLALAGTAIVRGRVLVAPGLSPIGVVVDLDDDGIRIEKPDGSFAYDQVSPGEHQLRSGRDPIAFTISSGETKEFVIDLRERAPCSVTVRVLHRGKAAKGMMVVSESGAGRVSLYSHQIGLTDAHGEVVHVFEGGERVSFRARAPSGYFLCDSSERKTIPSGGSLDTTLEIESGSLELRLPTTLEVPKLGELCVTLVAEEDEQSVLIRTPAMPSHFSTAQWSGPRVAIDAVPVGDFDIRVEPRRKTEALEAVPLAPTASGKVVIRAGETTVFEVKGP